MIVMVNDQIHILDYHVLGPLRLPLRLLCGRPPAPAHGTGHGPGPGPGIMCGPATRCARDKLGPGNKGAW